MLHTIKFSYIFREAIFIFITNNGQQEITDIVLRNYNNGYNREDLQLFDFELIIKAKSYQDKGIVLIRRLGYYKFQVIDNMIKYIFKFL